MAFLLTPGDVAYMEAIYNQGLPDTCTILRATETRTGAGGTAKAFAPIASAVPVHIASYFGKKGGLEVATNGRTESMLSWRFEFDFGTDVTVKDRITAGSRTFEVNSVDNLSSWSIGTFAYGEELT